MCERSCRRLCGYNHGGRILGNAAEGGKECAAVRIRSVYGGEFAGGFTGLMETADLAGTGNLKLLFGLLDTSNVLSLLGAVYPTETNTAVTALSESGYGHLE